MDQIIEPQPYTALMPYYPNLELSKSLCKISALTNRAEYEMVRRGYREANIYHMGSQNWDNQMGEIQEDGLCWLPIRRSYQYSGFSHKHFPANELGPNVMVYGVVARDIDVAKRFRDADLGVSNNGKCDHKIVGKYLGYPDCCVESFSKRFEKNFDPVFESALATEHEKIQDEHIKLSNFNSLLQVHLRYFGIRVIPWFPCEFNCEESGKKAKQWLDVIQTLDSKMSDFLIELLNKPSSWDLSLAQVIVKHPSFMGYVTSYYTKEHQVVEFIPLGEEN